MKQNVVFDFTTNTVRLPDAQIFTTYDPEAQAGYIYLHPGKAVRQEDLGHGIIVDLGEDGELVGIEVLLTKPLPPMARNEANGMTVVFGEQS